MAALLALVAVQDPQPAPSAATPRAQAQGRDYGAMAVACVGGTEAAQRAIDRLRAAIDSDYAGVHAAWRTLAEGEAKATLGRFLDLPLLDEAEVVISGKLVRAETDQAGVVDAHTLRLSFGELTVHKAPPGVRADLLGGGAFEVLRGRNEDSWLAALFARDLRGTAGARTYVFVRRELQHAGPKGSEARVLYYEYHLLPAAAGAAVFAQ